MAKVTAAEAAANLRAAHGALTAAKTLLDAAREQKPQFETDDNVIASVADSGALDLFDCTLEPEQAKDLARWILEVYP